MPDSQAPFADVIEVALQSDARFFPGLLATACSIAEHASSAKALRFHILDGGLGESNRAILESSVRKFHENVLFDYLSIDLSLFSDLPEWRGCGRMNWARLLLPTLLPDTEWIVYVDVDFLCLGDIRELWEEREENCSLLAGLDNWPLASGIEGAWFAANRKIFDSRTYFCSGLLLMNLKRFREERLVEQMAELLKRHDVLPAGDQSVLNVLFADRDDLKILPSRWQRFTRDIQTENLAERPFLHFAGEAPWVCLQTNRILNDASVFWFRYYAHLMGISLWRALREFYSPLKIVSCRVLFLLLAECRPARWAFNTLMKLIHHDESIVIYDAFLHRVAYPHFEK